MEEKKEKSKVKFFTVFRYFWPHVKKYKWHVVLVFFSVLVSSVASGVFSPVVYQKIIDAITVAQNPYLSQEIVSLFKLFVLIGVANFIANGTTGLVGNFYESQIIQSLQNDAFKRVAVHSRSFFANSFSGGLVAKFGRYVRAYESINDLILYNFFGPAITLVGILFVLFKKNPTIGVIFLLWFIVFSVVAFYFAKYKVPFDEEKGATESKTTATLSDVVSNILNVKIFSALVSEFKNYVAFTAKERDARLTTWNISIKQGVVLNGIMVALRMTSLWLAINFWVKGEITVGFVVLIQMYTTQLFDLVWQFNGAFRNFGRSVTDAKEMVEIFETPIDILDPEKPEKCKIKNGNINFESASFEYKDGKDVFKKFNLEIPAGQKVGFVGHSGSGKTTITNLLLRFEDVQKGAIKIDGQDIRNITQDDLRRNISYVPQEPALFHRTLRENIAYGKPNAKEKEIIAASKKAHADEFIKEFKEGYDTLVGERGVKLSGGQRQRVAIARVMLKDAPILVLDEATSSLDSISENLIQSAFDEAMKGRTTLVIAHRLSTIQKMDRIIVLEKGKIMEDGTHAELLAKNGYYTKLWQAQKGGMIG